MTTPKILNALQQYHHQLTRSKRILAIKKSLGIDTESEDQVSLSQEGIKRELIAKLSKEIVNNLLTAKKQPRLVKEIKQELEKEFDKKLLFEFNPKEKSIRVRREDKEELDVIEQEKIIKRLWDLTYNKINSTLST